jgi:hypothetical protein
MFADHSQEFLDKALESEKRAEDMEVPFARRQLLETARVWREAPKIEGKRAAMTTRGI